MRPEKIPSPKLDLVAWFTVVIFLAGIPLLVPVFHPDAGMDALHPNPSVLFIFLGLMGLITLTNLLVIFNWIRDPKSSTLSTALGNTLNFQTKLIGALFIVSGFVKLQDVVGFSYKLDEYWHVFGTEFMVPLSVIFAAFVSVFEVALAFALMTGYKMRLTSFFALAMIVFFTFLTGFSAITGSVTDCGCFGDALKLTPWETFTKDIFLTVAILPLYLLRKRIQPFYRKPIPTFATIGSFMLAAGISYYTYQNLPFIDFRSAYKVGANLEFNSTQQHKDGEMIAHDFSDFCADCSKNGFKGATLYIDAYNIDQAPDAALIKLRDLVNELKAKAPGIKLCGGTNTTSSGRKAITEKYGLDLCLSPQDEKTLKTITRSSPGYVFLKDAIVIQKWHHNYTPTVEELRNLAGAYADEAPKPAPREPLNTDQDSTGNNPEVTPPAGG